MSEIKVPRFRGKRVDKKYWGKPWVEGSCYKSSDGRIYIAPADFSVGTLKDFFAIWTEVEPSSLGLSTGLKDKNGVEIFGSLPGTRGGDRVKLFAYEQYREAEVLFLKSCFRVVGNDLIGNTKGFEFCLWSWNIAVEILGPAYDLEGK